MSDVASSDYLDTVADLNENTNEEGDENLDDILLPIQDLPKVTINLLRQFFVKYPTRMTTSIRSEGNSKLLLKIRKSYLMSRCSVVLF